MPATPSNPVYEIFHCLDCAGTPNGFAKHVGEKLLVICWKAGCAQVPNAAAAGVSPIVLMWTDHRCMEVEGLLQQSTE
jgi:hypothetical protein